MKRYSKWRPCHIVVHRRRWVFFGEKQYRVLRWMVDLADERGRVKGVVALCPWGSLAIAQTLYSQMELQTQVETLEGKWAQLGSVELVGAP